MCISFRLAGIDQETTFYILLQDEARWRSCWKKMFAVSLDGKNTAEIDIKRLRLKKMAF